MAFCLEHTVQWQFRQNQQTQQLSFHSTCNISGATIEEMQLISSLLSLLVKEKAVAAGKVIASLEWQEGTCSRHSPTSSQLTVALSQGYQLNLPPCMGRGHQQCFNRPSKSDAVPVSSQADQSTCKGAVALRPPHIKLCHHSLVGAQETLGSSQFADVNMHSSNRAAVEGPAVIRADGLHPAPDGVPSPSFPGPHSKPGQHQGPPHGSFPP